MAEHKHKCCACDTCYDFRSLYDLGDYTHSEISEMLYNMFPGISMRIVKNADSLNKKGSKKSIKKSDKQISINSDQSIKIQQNKTLLTTHHKRFKWNKLHKKILRKYFDDYPSLGLNDLIRNTNRINFIYNELVNVSMSNHFITHDRIKLWFKNERYRVNAKQKKISGHIY
jgi:hypothetical protein